jgi:hypothetical protein
MTDSEVSPKLGGLVSVSIYWKLETDFWTKSVEGGACEKTMTEVSLLSTQGRWRTHNFRIFEKF